MGAEPVVVLYASISVMNWMRAATGSLRTFQSVTETKPLISQPQITGMKE